MPHPQDFADGRGDRAGWPHVQFPLRRPASPPPSSPAPHRPAAVRLIELDGLRGLAAVVVLIHHILETVPALAEVGARPGVVPTGTFNRILTQSPLHLLWAGHEAVLIFFVLSGVA